jgi:4-amino-4-deoxy-L-arabinose transferase-like glycosyltransferase
MGLGFMTKGLLAPGVLALATLMLISFCREWHRRTVVASAALAIIAAAPWLVAWPVALYQESAALLVQWWRDSVSGFTAPQGAHDRLHYIRILPWYAWPSLPLALWVLWGTRVSRFARPAIQLPIVVFAVTFVALTLWSPARELNALPLLVPLALLATPAVDHLRRGAANSMYWFGVMAFTFFAVVAWVYWSGLELGVPRRLSAHLHRMQPAYESAVRWLPLLGAVALCCAWIALLAKLKRRAERPVIVWAAGMTLVWGLLNTLFLTYADVSKSYRSTISDLVQALPPRYDCISSRSLGESQRALLHYFGGIVTAREEADGGPRSCELLLAQGVRSEPPEIPLGWHQIWEGTRPGEKGEYFWLYGYGPAQTLR